MPIKNDNDHLPPAGPGSPLPIEQTILAKPLLDRWWKAYLSGPYAKRERAMPELPLRASMMGLRCDRALWYAITETPETNPSDISNVWVQRLGQIIGDELGGVADNAVDDEGKKHGWWAEDVVDLRPADYPGSAHGDLVYYDHGSPLYVGENKSMGGFAFQRTTVGANAEGARWSHIMQAALVAMAIGAPTIVVFYIATSAIGPDIAERNQLDEMSKIAAEWQFPTDLYRRDVEREINRQKRILKMATPNDKGEVTLPERTLDDPTVPAGAMIDNPAKARWVLLSVSDGSVVKSGEKWFCKYCKHRDRCIEDGPDQIKVKLTKKAA